MSAYASAHGEGPGSGAQETYLCHRLRLSDAERRESGVVSRAEKRRRAATFLLLAHSDARTTRELDLARRFPLGPDAHVAAYPIKAQNAFNIVTTHISNTVGLTEDWTARASKDIMLKRFEGWTETLLKCLRLAPPGELVEWALRIHLPLTGWIDGNTVLLADAAHATLPHIAQGAAQAGEDAAVLSTLLAKCQTKEEVPAALRMYEKLRKPRADWAVEMARITGTSLSVVVVVRGHLAIADADLAFFSRSVQARISTWRTVLLKRRVTRHSSERQRAASRPTAGATRKRSAASTASTSSSRPTRNTPASGPPLHSCPLLLRYYRFPCFRIDSQRIGCCPAISPAWRFLSPFSFLLHSHIHLTVSESGLVFARIK